MPSSQEIEDQIRDSHLKFLPVRDERIEWGMKFPMFIDAFNKTIAENNRVPSQDEFVQKYFEENESELNEVLLN